MSSSIRCVPAILTNDAIDLGKMVQMTESFTDFAQFDIMDGRFVPSQSVSCEQIASLRPKISWEAHLMVLHPETYLEDFKRAGAQKIVFHFEASPSPEQVISQIKKIGLQAGLAVNPETPNEAFRHLLDELDSVLFLSVNPGFYGAKFIPEVLDKIRQFRKAHVRMEIGIDGGVKENNIVEIAETGVNVIYIGSAIFMQPDPAAAYRRLVRLAEAYTPL